MTETSYEDGIWLIALTITCHIDQGIVLSQYLLVSPETKPTSPKKSRQNTLFLPHHEQVPVIFCLAYSTDPNKDFHILYELGRPVMASFC